MADDKTAAYKALKEKLKAENDVVKEIDRREELMAKEAVDGREDQLSNAAAAIEAEMAAKESENFDLRQMLVQKIKEQEEMGPARAFARTADALLGTRFSEDLVDKTSEYAKLLAALGSKDGMNQFRKETKQNEKHFKLARLATGNMRGSIVGKLSQSIQSLSLADDRINAALEKGGVYTVDDALQISTAWSAGEQLGSPSLTLIKNTAQNQTMAALIGRMEKWATGEISTRPVIKPEMLQHMKNQLEIIKQSRLRNRAQEQANLINTAGAHIYRERPELLQDMLSQRNVFNQGMDILPDPQNPGKVLPAHVVEEQAREEVKRAAKKDRKQVKQFSGKVKMRNPQGQVGLVPASQVDAAKAQGFVEVE